MNYYRPPTDEIRFLLETFDYAGQVGSLPKYADFDVDMCMDLVEGFAKFCVDVLLPLNAKGDHDGVQYDPETHDVTCPDGFKEAYAEFCANGFSALAMNPEYGGVGAPVTLQIMAQEIISACNKSFSMCPGLTQGLIESLEAHASDELKEYYLPRLVLGEWAGTMALTEPQCGTDLGLLSTKAEPFDDHY